MIVGVLLILLGIFAFIRPESMLTGAVVIYGVIAIVMGIEDLVVYARLSRFISFGAMLSLISGILSVMCGVMLIANPNVGKWALTILLPIWFIAHCISGDKDKPDSFDWKSVLLLFLTDSEHSRACARICDDL